MGAGCRGEFQTGLVLRLKQGVLLMTKKRGFKPPFLKGIITKMSDFKLRPFKAEPIQNPKSKIG
jgi:hypothetical protein